MNILFLATDAYGGHGGIAYYNRCLSEALAESEDVQRITLLPRLIQEQPTAVPRKVEWVASAAGSKVRYVWALARQLVRPVDLIICGHINLLPLATVLGQIKRVPVVLQVHGIDVWQEPNALFRWCVHRVSALWAVSTFTRNRMNAWAQLPHSRYTVIPNTIQPQLYGMAPNRVDLAERYGLQGKKVILTLARLDARERYKGIDEILDALPRLREQEPTLCYLIAGSGNDQPRLAQKAQQLGVADHVVFTGYVAEADKADLLRLADVFAMPGRGEGFGIVYLEAMACGIPVVGSLLDGSQDALQHGKLGQLVNPDDPTSLQAGLMRALLTPKHIPADLQDFAWPRFVQRVEQAIRLNRTTPLQPFHTDT